MMMMGSSTLMYAHAPTGAAEQQVSREAGLREMKSEVLCTMNGLSRGRIKISFIGDLKVRQWFVLSVDIPPSYTTTEYLRYDGASRSELGDSEQDMQDTDFGDEEASCGHGIRRSTLPAERAAHSKRESENRRAPLSGIV